MTELEMCEAELGELAELVVALQRTIGEGEIVDLSGLSAKTESLCARVAGLPSEENRAFAPRLEALVAALDTLCAEISARHEELLGQLAEAEAAGPGGLGSTGR